MDDYVNFIPEGQDKKEHAIRLTSYMMHKHYCENDVDALIRLFDTEFIWLGAGEQEYAVGADTVCGIFRQFAGMVPKCNISEEEYSALQLSPDTYLCSGRMWIETDPSTNVFLRAHQRVSTVFRFREGRAFCCHIHISNPYMEMAEDDIGFPTRMAKHTSEYLQEQIEEQKKLIEEKTAELTSIYNSLPCGIVRMLRTPEGCRLLTFNQAAMDILAKTGEEIRQEDWSKGYTKMTLEEDREDLRDALLRLKEPGDRTTVRFRLQNGSGGIRVIRSINSLISRGEEGDVIQRIAFDITSQVELERALERQSYQDSLTGLFNRNKFNQELDDKRYESAESLGVAYFDINGLKRVNDQMGHSAGDDLIRRSASHIARVFPGKGYRVGGDEFVVINDNIPEQEFRDRLQTVLCDMLADHIHISAGFSWRDHSCNLLKQFNEADRNMYQDKAEYYRDARNDRRKR